MQLLVAEQLRLTNFAHVLQLMEFAMPNAEADALLHLHVLRLVNSALQVEDQRIHLSVFASTGVRRVRLGHTSMFDRD